MFTKQKILTVILLGFWACNYNAAAHESECTNKYRGASSCDFDKKNWCGWVSDPSGQYQWEKADNREDGPSMVDYRPSGKEEKEGGYVYLTSGDKLSSASVETHLSTGISAMCTVFRYATTSPSEIELYLKVKNTRRILHTLKANDTHRQWRWFGVSCCLKSPSTQLRKIGFTSTVLPGEVTALDYIEMRLSNRECKVDEEDECFLVPPPTLPPPTAPADTKQKIGSATSSLVPPHTDLKEMSGTDANEKSEICDFDDTERNCRWTSSSAVASLTDGGPFTLDYRPPGRQHQEGGYLYWTNLGGNEVKTDSIQRVIPKGITAMRITFRFAATDLKELALRMNDGEVQSVLYTLVAEDSSSDWQWFGVSCCLTPGKKRQISITSTVAPLGVIALDYIETTLSENKCDYNQGNRCTFIPGPTSELHEDTTVIQTDNPDNRTTAQIETPDNTTTAQTETPDNTTTAQTETPDNTTTAQTETPDNTTTAQTETPDNTTTAQTETPDESKAIQTENPHNTTTNETENPDDTTPVQTENPHNTTTIETEDPDDTTPVQTENPHNTTTVDTEDPDDAIPVQTENPHNTTTVETEDPDDTTPVQTENPHNTTTVETEDLDDTTPVQTENPHNMTTIETEDPDDTTPVQTENPRNTTTIDTEDPDDATPVQTENPHNTTTIETEDPDDTTPVQTENPHNTTTVDTEDPDDATPVQTENPHNTTTNETENPDDTTPVQTENPHNTTTIETENPDDTTPVQTAERPHNMTTIETENPDDTTPVQTAERPHNMTTIETENPDDKTPVQTENLKNTTMIQAENPDDTSSVHDMSVKDTKILETTTPDPTQTSTHHLIEELSDKTTHTSTEKDISGTTGIQATNTILTKSQFIGVITGGLIVCVILIVIVAGLVGLCSRRRTLKRGAEGNYSYSSRRHPARLDDGSRPSSSDSQWKEVDFVLPFRDVASDDQLLARTTDQNRDCSAEPWQFYNGQAQVLEVGIKSTKHDLSRKEPPTSCTARISAYGSVSTYSPLNHRNSPHATEQTIVPNSPIPPTYKSSVFRPLSNSWSDTSSVYSIPRPSLRCQQDRKRRPSVFFDNPMYTP